MDQLHVCALVNTGGLYHTIRRADGSWTPFSRVSSNLLNSASCTVINGTLHIVVVRPLGGSQNTLEHIARAPNGTFSAWGNVNGATASSLSFTMASSSEVAGDLHAVANSGGRTYHSIRSTATTNWTFFGDVNTVTGFPTGFTNSDSD